MIRIRIPGVAGKIEARADRLHRAVIAELDRVMAAKEKKSARRTVAGNEGKAIWGLTAF
jgi:hypothetical protein